MYTKYLTHLLIQENLTLEKGSEVLDLGADIFLHHSIKRDPEFVQLRFQRRQLCSLLQKEAFIKVLALHLYFVLM